MTSQTQASRASRDFATFVCRVVSVADIYLLLMTGLVSDFT